MLKYLIVLGIFILVILLIFAPVILYFKLGWFKKFYHDLLGWHQPINDFKFNGSSLKSRCKYCGEEIMMDSQGNWF